MTNRPFSDEEIDIIVVRAVSAFIAATAMESTDHQIYGGDVLLGLAKRVESYILLGDG